MEQGPKVPSDITANQDVPGLPQADETDQHLSRLSSLDHVWAAHLRGNDPCLPIKKTKYFKNIMRQLTALYHNQFQQLQKVELQK